MPKEIVSKFCFLLVKCGQQVDIGGIIRDSYLFEVELKLLFSSLLGASKWCFLGCTDTFCQRWWWYRMSFWIKFWVCRRAILINIFLQVALNLNRNDGIGYNRRRIKSSTSLGSVFMMWAHSRVNHKDHKFSTIWKPLGKDVRGLDGSTPGVGG